MKIKTSYPIYVDTSDTCGNPYRLTPYVDDAGELWLAADGNGAADDIPLDDLDGHNDSEVWRKWCEVDVAAMRRDADEIASAGMTDVADWLRDWCDRVERVQHGHNVDAETLENAMHELRANGYGAEADVIGSIREVWSDETSAIYKTDVCGYILLSDGSPSFFEDVSETRKQIF